MYRFKESWIVRSVPDTMKIGVLTTQNSMYEVPKEVFTIFKRWRSRPNCKHNNQYGKKEK